MDTAQILTDLRIQRDRITAAIIALESLNGTGITRAKSTASVKGAKTAPATRRVISAAGRKRIAEAQKARWAKKKRAIKASAKKAAAVAPVATEPAKAAPVASTGVKGARKPMNPATKKKLAAAAKARWAAKKTGAKKEASKA